MDGSKIMAEEKNADWRWQQEAVKTKPEPVWTGNLDQDCMARWAGFTLRAWLREDGWMWYASLDESEIIIDSSHDLPVLPSSGIIARNSAKSAVLEYLRLQ